MVPSEWLEADIPTWVWVVAVVGIDVSHVWSSIYRTYLSPTTRATWPKLLFLVPIGCFLVCGGLAWISDQLLWRVLAYVAVYHFVKQQIGITALYRVRYHQTRVGAELSSGFRRAERHLDHAAVYAATLAPVLYWHTSLPRSFDWFVPGDFVDLRSLIGLSETGWHLILGLLWLLPLLLWLGFHGFWWAKGVRPSFGKMLWVGTTVFNWGVGIVLLNSDLAFTLSNVVAHGIPYLGLIALWRFRNDQVNTPTRPFGQRALATGMMLVPVLALALTEEYLWDFLIYRDHHIFFETLVPYAQDMVQSQGWRAFWIGILCLPQTVHYIFDGYIWRMGGQNPGLEQLLFPETKVFSLSHGASPA